VVVTTDNPWPDYVFSSGYKLNPLQEVKSFINQNKHLPNIPSAQEVKENGISLGEMNAKLLEKVEELTLHLIKQEERLNKQEKQIEAQKEMIDKLLKDRE